MTEKRFECYDLIFLDGFIRDTLTNENIVEPIKLIHLLNELHEENHQLKKELEECRNNKLFSRRELEKENKELKKQLGREETDKKRLMSYLMRYKGFSFEEIVEDFLDNSYYDNWWEDEFYKSCWDEYLKEKDFDGCDEE